MMDEGRSELQQQIDDLVAAVSALAARAETSEQRAQASEQRVEALEARSLVDRELIAELQADGVLRREHVTNLELALVTSRTIGAALGILMANRNIGEEEALKVLKGASQRTNTRMRDLAQTIVAGADAIK